jgi:Protein of unknown function (DUF2846)
MKSAFVLILFTLSAFAQQEPGIAGSACGPKKTTFAVKLDETQHTLAEPEAGKALVYFIQDVGAVVCLGGCFQTRFGVDGAWVGAVQHNSYFSVSVEPGEHHLCASSQSHFAPAMSEKYASVRLALSHFTAEAGKIYYFRTRSFGSQNQQLFEMDVLDGDQAKYLIASYPVSVSHAKP